ncbi:MAG: radical SAM protein [Cytophagales bacterium]|nr:radical SAM protein [Cytophagales bacterium]
MNTLLPVMNLAELTLIPTYVCTSANCIGCYKKTFKEYEDTCVPSLNINDLMPFLRRYTLSACVHSFGITGGEFTEYAECGKLIAALSNEFPVIPIEIVTNGQDHLKIMEIVESARIKENLTMRISIDGYGESCDKLRRKEGYFEEAIRSIEVMADYGLIPGVRINCRYYPGEEGSVFRLRDYLGQKFGISEKAFSVSSVTYKLLTPGKTQSYLIAIHKFASKFWKRTADINLPNTPSLLLKGARCGSSSCVPAVHPDGTIHACDTLNGTPVGNIKDHDTDALINRLVKVGKLNLDQCDFGKCVLKHYEHVNTLV